MRFSSRRLREHQHPSIHPKQRDFLSAIEAKNPGFQTIKRWSIYMIWIKRLHDLNEITGHDLEEPGETPKSNPKT